MGTSPQQGFQHAGQGHLSPGQYSMQQQQQMQQHPQQRAVQQHAPQGQMGSPQMQQAFASPQQPQPARGAGRKPKTFAEVRVGCWSVSMIDRTNDSS
jgi:hypothetical protein